jgi:hypothetical protein
LRALHSNSLLLCLKLQVARGGCLHGDDSSLEFLGGVLVCMRAVRSKNPSRKNRRGDPGDVL